MASVVAEFVELLSQAELLTPVQLHDMSSWLPQEGELTKLTKELVNRGWLTNYQVSRINEGDYARLSMGPYILLEELGQGGMGCVYKARHRRLDRVVARKVINPSDLSHPEAVRRFQREAKAIARLRHPNIVMLYDADEIDGTHFLALEYVQGIDLDKLVLEKGQLELNQACDCIRQAALGLQHAHERGLVHRDIKPANLLLMRDNGDDNGDLPVERHESPAGGLIKILDLGLARFSNIRSEVEKLSVDGIIVGTPDYLAPEQALDSSKVDIRADIYSLGCTFYELLTGQTPFANVTGTQKLIAHIQDEPPALHTLRAGLPPELVQIIKKMMAKKPYDRFETPGQVAEALECLPDIWHRASTGGSKEPINASSADYAAAGCTGLIRFTGPKGGSSRISKMYAEQPRELPEHTGTVYCAAFSTDGRYALTGGEDKALCLWDINACKKLRRLSGHTDAVMSVAFAPDNRFAVSGSRDRSVLIWDVETGQHVARLRGLKSVVLAVAFTPDGKLILTGAQDTTLAVWERQSQKMLRPLGGLVRDRHFGPITSLAVTADNGRALSSSGDGSIRLWNLKTGVELHCFSGHIGAVQCVALSPDGLHMASGGADKAVRNWGVLSGTELSRGVGHTTSVRGLAFSPDGRDVLSADEHTVRVWETATARETFCSRDDAQVIHCMALSPDGRLILTGGSQKNLCLWKRHD